MLILQRASKTKLLIRLLWNRGCGGCVSWRHPSNERRGKPFLIKFSSLLSKEPQKLIPKNLHYPKHIDIVILNNIVWNIKKSHFIKNELGMFSFWMPTLQDNESCSGISQSCLSSCPNGPCPEIVSLIVSSQYFLLFFLSFLFHFQIAELKTGYFSRWLLAPLGFLNGCIFRFNPKEFFLFPSSSARNDFFIWNNFSFTSW